MAGAEDFLAQALRSRLFRRVPSALVESLVSTSDVRSLKAGEALLEAGQDNDTVYLVTSGAVDVAASERSPAATVTPGDCVGAWSIVDSSPVRANAVARVPTTVLAIGRVELWKLINTSAEVARNLLVVLAGGDRDDGEVAAAESAEAGPDHATVDGITGLRNRAWLDDAFDRQLQRTTREGEPVALLMIDIDHFSQLNKEHGHFIGDAVLRRTARLLGGGLRPQDLVARYSAEAFAVLLPNADTDLAASIAERLRQAVRTVPLERIDERLPTTSVSIGVATATEVVPLQDLFVAATAALQRAKVAGRDQVSI